MQPDGAQRSAEFRQMVRALHGIGLRVVLDVVYNHTFHSGGAPHQTLTVAVIGMDETRSQISMRKGLGPSGCLGRDDKLRCEHLHP